ncbi:hypothetical protein JCM19241_3079 [Vibrio ishigakensis]|uniref:PcfJ-like protein n=1 Tax=Vibrio ishigakensis TaxID=1481914 RepID=A0A0B8QG69_9VIBR|nr:hypothetical protein JCM19241_3079 [Vibrio ishigakensis]
MTAFVVPIANLGFGYDLEFNGWDKGLDGFRLLNDGKRERLEGGLGFGLNMLLSFEGSYDWKSQIPKPIYDATSKYPEYQYQMLWLASNYTQARDLLSSRPMLLALICMNHSVDNALASELVQMGQREILKRLGLDGSKACLRFLDKVERSERLSTALRLVRSLLCRNERRYQRFNHYQEISYSSVILDHTFPFLTGTRLGFALANEGTRRGYSMSSYISDTLRLGEHIGIADPISVLERIPSIEALRELHDRWSDRRMEMQFPLQKPKDTDKPYPRLFESTDGINQILNYEQLSEEAKVQRHCISIYHNRIVNGHYSAYRLLSPERMTIGIRHVSSKRFPYEIDQIAGKRNALPSEESRRVVQLWFEKNRSAYLNNPQ